MRALRRDQRGFTLIELMVVLAIIAFILVFAVPNVVEALRAARIRTVEAQARQIQVAMEQHLLDHGEYPEPPQTLSDDYFFGENGLLRPYLAVPTDTPTFNVKAYSIPNDNTYCMVIEVNNVGDTVQLKYFKIEPDAIELTSSSSCN